MVLDLPWNLIALSLILSPLLLFYALVRWRVAKALNIPVESFSMGFGPPLMGGVTKSGIKWKISLFPMGGYTYLNSPSNFGRKASFHHFLMAFSGPLSLVILGFVMNVSLLTLKGRLWCPPIIGKVIPYSPAARAGIVPGDHIVNVVGEQFFYYKHSLKFFNLLISELQRVPASSPLRLELNRRKPKDSFGNPPDPYGNDYTFTLTSCSSEGSWLGKVGILPDLKIAEYDRASLKEALSGTLGYLNPSNLIHSFGLEESPLSLIQKAGAVFYEGFIPILYFSAMIAIALGFSQLLPLPSLEGQTILFSLIELIRGHPLSARMRGMISLICILSFMGFLICWKNLRYI